MIEIQVKGDPMKRFIVLGLAVLTALVSFCPASGQEPAGVPQNIKAIIGHNCSVSGCHRGKYPTGGLNLEPDKILASALNVSSSEAPGRVIIGTADPARSYLLA